MDKVVTFRPYPFRVGEKIHIEDGPRRGDWEVVGVSEASFTDNTMEKTKKGKKKADEPLPFCTTAPSAEHARGPNEDEPCDDSREAK